MKKEVIINNSIDYKRFVNRLWFYKYLFFVEFNTSYENLKPICGALNIKPRNKRIEYIYNYACNIMNEEMKKTNICDFCDNKCFVQRLSGTKNCNGCCLTCPYLNDGKCSTNNLSCKLFYCPTVKRKYKVKRIRDIDILKLFSIRQRFILKIDFYSSYEEVIRDLESYSVILPVLRILSRHDKVK